ncbi:phosphatase PAP2 family protein [Rhizobium sp. No.120]
MWKFASNSWSSGSDQMRPRQPQATADSGLAVIGMMIVWTSFVFVVFPKLDLAVARLFAHGHAFWLAENLWLKAVRDIARQSQPYILGAMSVIVVLHVFLPRRLRFCPPHKPLFVLLSFAAGPLLIVQTLKAAIGRVRPRNLIEFGGTADFTPVWQFSGACSRNCSFPSGEAAAAAAALSMLILVPARHRWIAAAILVPCSLFVAFNRVIFGAHFLSDVMLAWLLTIFAMIVIWRWISVNSRAVDRYFTRLMFR